LRVSSALPVIAVAAGCLVNERDEVLIAQRPAGKIAAGKWEFPGGKIEPGETARQALDRELREELGITITEARPLIRITHAYSDRIVVLDTWRVRRFTGDLHPHDGQGLAWVKADALMQWDLLAADRPIVTALRLPPVYVFTRPDADAAGIEAGLAQLPRGSLLRLRFPGRPDDEYETLARQLVPRAQREGLRIVLDRDPSLVQACGAHAWHATSRTLLALEGRPLIAGWAIASCHDAAQLARARDLGFDAAVLGPVRETPTHPESVPLGWPAFESLATASNLPVYAIGGVGPDEATSAFAHYAQGVAGISAFWR
jgi:8-oxo-dGTP diphosphatase